mmetsp:Transcript_4875/g.11562  ORF Transcript_4875/g.11562 Transcript_4875/m.11562 type:complete len:283 (+) Transcript_4875:70-918(+)
MASPAALSGGPGPARAGGWLADSELLLGYAKLDKTVFDLLCSNDTVSVSLIRNLTTLQYQHLCFVQFCRNYLQLALDGCNLLSFTVVEYHAIQRCFYSGNFMENFLSFFSELFALLPQLRPLRLKCVQTLDRLVLSSPYLYQLQSICQSIRIVFTFLNGMRSEMFELQTVHALAGRATIKSVWIQPMLKLRAKPDERIEIIEQLAVKGQVHRSGVPWSEVGGYRTPVRRPHSMRKARIASLAANSPDKLVFDVQIVPTMNHHCCIWKVPKVPFVQEFSEADI